MQIRANENRPNQPPLPSSLHAPARSGVLGAHCSYLGNSHQVSLRGAGCAGSWAHATAEPSCPRSRDRLSRARMAARSRGRCPSMAQTRNTAQSWRCWPEHRGSESLRLYWRRNRRGSGSHNRVKTGVIQVLAVRDNRHIKCGKKDGISKRARDRLPTGLKERSCRIRLEIYSAMLAAEPPGLP